MNLSIFHDTSSETCLETCTFVTGQIEYLWAEEKQDLLSSLNQGPWIIRQPAGDKAPRDKAKEIIVELCLIFTSFDLGLFLVLALPKIWIAEFYKITWYLLLLYSEAAVFAPFPSLPPWYCLFPFLDYSHEWSHQVKDCTIKLTASQWDVSSLVFCLLRTSEAGVNE